MTQKPVPSLIIQLGIPTMISMFVTTIYNMADAYFVGQINTSASGATSVVLGLMAILQAIGFMFGHGSGSLISRMLFSIFFRPALTYGNHFVFKTYLYREYSVMLRTC